MSGLTLRMSHLKKLGSQWYSLLYGIVAILLITPVLALAAQRLPLEPKGNSWTHRLGPKGDSWTNRG